MIKAIVFDFFGVLCSDHYWQYAKQYGQNDPRFQTYADEVNLGKIPWQEFVKKTALATDKSIDDVNRMYETEQIDPRVTGLIIELHKSYKTGLLTNAHHEFIDSLLTEQRLADIFDTVVVSSRLGVVKPSPQIFEYTLEKLDVEPQETIFIDDAERNTTAAADLGMQTILFEDFEQCKRELDSILSHA